MRNDDTQKVLDWLKAVCEAEGLSPGPWHGTAHGFVFRPDLGLNIGEFYASRENAEFAALSRTALPAMGKFDSPSGESE